MASLPHNYVSPEEYLAHDRDAEEKSEYFDGEVLPLMGANPRHNLIVANLTGALISQLRNSPCRVYASQQKIRAAIRRYFYPDITLICEPTRLDGGSADIVLNPTVVIEVLSDSTMSFARGRKFLTYQQMPSLQQYVMVWQDEERVESYQRQENAWLYTQTTGLESSAQICSVPISLSDIYRNADIA